MGWLRNLFGGTVDSEYREDGKRVKKSVSKGQFDSLMRKAVAEDKATLHGACVVHILDPMHDGPRTESWIIGENRSVPTLPPAKYDYTQPRFRPKCGMQSGTPTTRALFGQPAL